MPSTTSRLAALGLVGSLAALAPLAHAAAAATTPTTTVAATVTATAATATSAAPVNLLTGDSGALTSGTGAWYADNGTVALAGPGVLATTTTTAGWSVTASGLTTAARPGTVYTGTYQVQAATVARQVVPYLYFFNSAGTVLDKVKGTVTQDATGSWTATTAVVGIAPAGATSVALASLTWGSAAGEVHTLRAPLLTSTTVAGTDVVGPLRTVGNQVYDARGPVVLRGVNRIGLESSAAGRSLTDDDFVQAKRWGASMVRVPLSSAFWLSTNCKYDASYAGLVDGYVQQITSRGMVALLDLHTNNIGGCGAAVQRPMADLTAVDFWTQVAARYRSNPLVAFELYNEPHDISDAVWLNGGTATQADGSTYQAVGMQKLYNTVRATGATNLVFVNGTNWASTPASRFVTGTNIVHGVHAYTCPTGLDSCNANPLQPPASLNSWVTAGATTPVVVTEFGYPSAGSGAYNANVIALLKSRGWGWTAFAWDGTSTGLFSLLSTAGSGASYQPSASGMPVLSALAG